MHAFFSPLSKPWVSMVRLSNACEYEPCLLVGDRPLKVALNVLLWCTYYDGGVGGVDAFNTLDLFLVHL